MHPAPPDEPHPLSPRQLWTAARRLAADEPDVVAAAAAGVRTLDLRAARAADPDFGELVDAFRAIKALPPEAKRERLADLCWDGAERAILDGRVSTLNQCVRALRLLDDPDGDAEEHPYDTFLAGLTEDELDELEAVSKRKPAATTPAEEPSPRPSPIPGGTGEGVRPAVRPGELEIVPPLPSKMGEGGGEGSSSAPADLRGPCPRPPEPADPFPWPAAPDPAAALNVPRPNPNGPTVPRLRIAREPVPPWVGQALGRPPPRWGP